MVKWICPVCFWPDLDEEPHLTYEICIQCGTEFGYADCNTNHAILRANWIKVGHPFYFEEHKIQLNGE